MPLLPGLVVSGNSFVGDTLILGDADDAQARREFLALFGEAIESEAEAATVASVYERTAHRATVLVHEGLDEDLRTLVASVAGEMAPAHVLLKVIAAREPFLVDVAGLVGYDSYLREPLAAGDCAHRSQRHRPRRPYPWRRCLRLAAGVRRAFRQPR